MIDREHPLSVARQAKLLDISRGAVYVCVRPTHLDDGRGDRSQTPAGTQRCGSSSSMRLLGQDGSLSITSLR
jgi:hypothetical protein